MSADKPDVAALIAELSEYSTEFDPVIHQAAAALQSQQARIAELEKLVAELEGHIDAALRIINS